MSPVLQNDRHCVQCAVSHQRLLQVFRVGEISISTSYCVCAISSCTFLYLQYIYLYHTCVLKSEFGHIWLLATLVYLLKFLYVNSCVVGGRIGRNFFSFFFFFSFFSLKKNQKKSCPLYVFTHFSAVFCMAHCALDLAKDHAP